MNKNNFKDRLNSKVYILRRYKPDGYIDPTPSPINWRTNLAEIYEYYFQQNPDSEADSVKIQEWFENQGFRYWIATWQLR